MQLLLLAQSPVLRIGLRGILESALPIERVIEANNALEATNLGETSGPMLTVIQDSLPGVTGVVAARVCRDLHPTSVIVVLSERSEPERARIAIEYGANALLAAEIAPVELIRVINEFFANELTESQTSDALQRDQSALAGGEIAVLDGLVRGLSFRDIAEALFLGEQTVKASTATLLRKLNAADRTTAVVAAIRSGLVDLSVQLPIHLSPAGSFASPVESFSS